MKKKKIKKNIFKDFQELGEVFFTPDPMTKLTEKYGNKDFLEERKELYGHKEPSRRTAHEQKKKRTKRWQP